MKYKVDSWNNFCRVFKLPKKYPDDFCNPAIPVVFQMVDWFNPVTNDKLFNPGISKEEWIKRFKVKSFDLNIQIESDDLQKQLTKFLKNKFYVEKDNKYLVICEFGFSFTFKS